MADGNVMQEVTGGICEKRSSGTPQERRTAWALIKRRSRAPVYTAVMREHYSSARQIPPEVIADIAEYVDLRPHSRVLDVGCGPGDISLQLSRSTDHVIGIDISYEFVDIARQRALETGAPAFFIQWDANDLSIFQASADVVVASQVVHWLEPQRSVVELVNTVRRPGYLIFLESKPNLPATHPLRIYMKFGEIGEVSAEDLGKGQHRYYADLLLRESNVGAAFDIEGSKTFWFKQRLLFGREFASSYFFANAIHQRLQGEGSSEAKVQAIFANYADDRLYGSMLWVATAFHFV